MRRCPSCSREAPDDGRFCPACGAALDSASWSPTRTALRPPDTSAGAVVDPGAARVSPYEALPGRFLPGALVAGRYRVIGLIGKGGMGEVYRADDLKLGQAVALKFLPENVDRDAGRLARLLNEVKIARQVSHPGVCRVYDIAETEGRHFISMEFVDGEDLATLLRRIGRLPRDKALQIARQLCAGLAAAHEQGVLHRDLKPANIMIDGRGRARITDFGLARLLGEGDGREVPAGTPAYMAPELLAGGEASIRSDLYGLGLVLYELFTGRAAFKAATPADLRRLQTETTPASPSGLVDGFDPVVERVILRCLETDPRNRPGSALAVATALPGGDPLAAALAAGETPSPDLVAEAGEFGSLRPAVAGVCLGWLVLGFVVVVALSARTQLVRVVPLPKPPEVLTERAREVTRRLGYSETVRDSTYGLSVDSGGIGRLVELDRTGGRWNRLAAEVPGVIYFWYKQSPRYLIPANDLARSPSYEDPPLTLPGMVGVHLDPIGNLRRFEAVPPERDDSRGPWPETDWSRCFAEAGLDPRDFSVVDSIWSPPSYADRRTAWEGSYPARPQARIRIEAASYHGRPTFFRILEPWTRADRTEIPTAVVWETVSRGLFGVVVGSTLIACVLLARRNTRLGRVDRKGATRLGLVAMTGDYLGWLLKAHHVPEVTEMGRCLLELALPLLIGCTVWLFYLALEPYARRLWPRMLVSWVRVLDGRLRDPLVGRDVLLGVIVGTGLALLDQLYVATTGWLGLPTLRPDQGDPRLGFQLISLRGLRFSLGNLVGNLIPTLFFPLLFLVVLLLLRLLLRRQGLAVGAFLALGCVLDYSAGVNPFLHVAAFVLSTTLILVALFRGGLLTAVIASFQATLLTYYPLTFDLTDWSAGNTVLVVLVTAGLAAYGARMSLGRRPIVREAVLQS